MFKNKYRLENGRTRFPTQGEAEMHISEDSERGIREVKITMKYNRAQFKSGAKQAWDGTGAQGHKTEKREQDWSEKGRPSGLILKCEQRRLLDVVWYAGGKAW
ncbi:MAG: hypothetical protein ACKVU2_04995 [Saprospiraceae bacterium]